MIGAPADLGFVIFLMIVSSIIFPILSLITINIILDEIKKKLLFRFISNLSFIAIFLIFQQNLIQNLPNYFTSILITESIITIFLIIYLTLKVIKIWRN
jgi:hypothetical protein